MAAVVDLTALLTAILIAAAIAGALLLAHRDGHTRRGWGTAAALVVLLGLLAMADLSRESPRETHLSTPLIAVLVATISALGMVRGTRRVRMWLRAPLIFVTTFVLLLGTLLLSAAYLSPILPF